MADQEVDSVIRCYQAADEAAVIEVWNQCDLVVPWNDPKTDIAKKVQAQPEFFLVAVFDGRVIATVMAGSRISSTFHS